MADSSEASLRAAVAARAAIAESCGATFPLSTVPYEVMQRGMRVSALAAAAVAPAVVCFCGVASRWPDGQCVDEVLPRVHNMRAPARTVCDLRG